MKIDSTLIQGKGELTVIVNQIKLINKAKSIFKKEFNEKLFRV